MMTTVGAAALEEGGEDHPGEEGHEAQVHGQELLLRHEQAAQHAVDGAQGGAVGARHGHSPGGFALRRHGGGDDETRPEAVVVAEEQAQQDGKAEREAALGRRHEPTTPRPPPADTTC